MTRHLAGHWVWQWQTTRIARAWIALLACFVLGAAAAPAQGAPAESAADVVRKTADQVLDAVSSDQSLTTNQDKLFGFVNQVVLPHFDFTRMSQRVLGKHWRSATPGQQDAFVDAFQGLIVRTYATAIAGYQDQKVSIADGREEGDKATVKMDITREGGPPIPIVYTMGLVDDRWKVYDVVVDGVSLVITYRTTFSTEVRKSGMDGLIKRLKDHTGKGA